jgi:DNA polymerase-3 subunit gamma/tau
VARSATGSFRDALGTLEQLLAYAGTEIATEDVLAVLGAADADLVFGAVDAVAAGDAREALLAAARLAESGRDVGRFFADLEAHARGLMVVQTLGSVPDELRVTAEQDARLAEQAERIVPADVVRLLDLIAAALRAVKDGADARTQLELTLVKAAVPAHDPSARALQSRLERLEALLGGAPPAGEPPGRAPSVAATAAGRASRPAPATPDPVIAGRATPAPAVPPAAHDAPATPDPATATPGTPAPGTPAPALPGAAPTPEPATARAPGDRHDIAAEAAGAAASAAAASHEPVAVAVVEAREGGAAPTVGIGVAGAEGADVAVGVELDLEGLAELWPAVLDSLRGESELVHAMLADARPTRLADGELTLTFTGALSKGKAENPATQALIGRAVRAVTGSTLRLACRLDPGGGPAGAPAATLSEDELIRRFVAEFDAEELPPEPDDDVPQSP